MTQYQILRLAYIAQKDIWNTAREQKHKAPTDHIAIEMERIAYEELREISYMMAEELKKAE